MTEDPRNISIKDYTYELPPGKIAQNPLADRDRSKLLVHKKDGIHTDTFKNITGYIPEGSLLVFNDTKVVQARLLFENEDGKVIEVFCLEPADNSDYTRAFAAKGSCKWLCMVGNLRKWKEGSKEGALEKQFQVYSQMCTLKAEKQSPAADSFIIKFSWEPEDITFGEILETAGLIPLPPYIKRSPAGEDKERYQTVYSRYEGSVAAPTAGLHFTDEVLKSLKEKNAECLHVTLHVGAGTFKPVKSETIGGHEMHRELITIPRETVEAIKNNPEYVICVGTTSLRTIESLYWIGLKLANEPASIQNIQVSQWEPYERTAHLTTAEALDEILRYMDSEGLTALTGYTEIIVVPGYEFKIARGLITNFHQPQSTLLLLIAAFAGDNWRKIYDYALENEFRFLSYGDSSLLLR
jgi:S-adenosylmethionine:tRNA ribosyltransferase-isomerase